MTTDKAHDDVYDRGIAYEEGDKIVYRASGLGMCIGALVRARLGVTASGPGEMMQQRWDEGKDWENELVRMVAEKVNLTHVTNPDHLGVFGKLVEHGEVPQVETEIAWGNKIVRCHPDAFMAGQDLRTRVVEVKFLSEDFAAQKVKDVKKQGARGLGGTYAWQLAVEMHSTGLSAVYGIGVKKLAEGKGEREVVGVADLKVWEFDTAPYTLSEIKARVLEVEGWVRRGEMPTCPEPKMYPCPYWQDHEDAEKEVVEDHELEYRVARWKQAKGLRDQAIEELEVVRGDVLERMQELGLGEARCDGVKVTVLPAVEKGNVSWSKAYQALSKLTGKRVDEEEFKGEGRGPSVRIVEEKD